MLLSEQPSQKKREEVIFEIVNQLKRGAHLIASVEERELVAGLNDDHVRQRRPRNSAGHFWLTKSRHQNRQPPLQQIRPESMASSPN